MPSNGQISQLVLQVDANIAVAQRSLNELARTVQQSTGQMNASLAANDGAITNTMSQHHKLGLAFNNARIAQTELTAAITRSADAYGAGASPLRILSTEIGRLTEAAAFLGGGAGNGVLGTIVRFMGGPWGIALLLGGTILAKLTLNHKEAADSVDVLVEKMRKQAQLAAAQKQANEVWASTLDGVTDALNKNAEALGKLEKGEDDAATKALAAAIAADERLKILRAETVANIELAKSLLDVERARASGTGSQAETAQFGLTQRIAELDTFQNNLSDIDKQVGIADEQIRRATLDVYAAAANKDQSELVKAHYAELIKQATARAQAEHLTGVELQKQIILLNQERDAELKALEAAKSRKSQSSGEFGKQISFADAESIARGAGLTVTSGYRSEAKQAELYRTVRTAANPVARPGTSAHEGVNGKWALDIAFEPGLTPQKLRKLYGDQGVSLSAIYKESGHFHIEGSRSQAAAADRSAAAAAQKAQIGDDTFARQGDQLDAELLQVRKQLLSDYDSQAAFAEQELEAQKQAQIAAIQKEVDSKQITAVQGNILRAKVVELSAAKQAIVEQQRIVKALEADQAAMDQRYGFAVDDLKFADEMATTQADHRKLQLQILDIQYQQKLVDLQILLAKQRQLGDLQGAALTQGQINNLGNAKAQDQARVRQGTLDPLQAWAKQVPQTAAEINQWLQTIEVQGLDGLASAITDVITGTKSLKQAFGELAQSVISEIIQMTVKMLIFRAISSLIGGSVPSPDLSTPASVNIGGGSMVPGSSSFGFLPGWASGGSTVIGGNGGIDQNLLSLNGQPLARVGKGETLAVIPNPSRIGAPGAANSNAPQKQIVEVHLKDEMLDARIADGANVQIIRAYPGIRAGVSQARMEARRRSSHR